MNKAVASQDAILKRWNNGGWEVKKPDDKYSSNMDETLTPYEKYLQQHDSIHCLQTTDFQPYIKSDAIIALSSRNSSSFALRKVIYRISKAEWLGHRYENLLQAKCVSANAIQCVVKRIADHWCPFCQEFATRFAYLRCEKHRTKKARVCRWKTYARYYTEHLQPLVLENQTVA